MTSLRRALYFLIGVWLALVASGAIWIPTDPLPSWQELGQTFYSAWED